MLRMTKQNINFIETKVAAIKLQGFNLKLDNKSPFIIHNWKIFSTFASPFGVATNKSCACGEIGRRARLRIWCSDTCRFESYQAHDVKVLRAKLPQGTLRALLFK